MGFLKKFLGDSKNLEMTYLSLEDSDEGNLWLEYDKRLEKDKFYIYFDKRKKKKYYSKDIKNLQIVNKKEMDGALDYVFGATTKRYVKISFTDGTEKVYELSDSESKSTRLKAIELFEKYHNK